MHIDVHPLNLGCYHCIENWCILRLLLICVANNQLANNHHINDKKWSWVLSAPCRTCSAPGCTTPHCWGSAFFRAERSIVGALLQPWKLRTLVRKAENISVSAQSAQPRSAPGPVPDFTWFHCCSLVMDNCTAATSSGGLLILKPGWNSATGSETLQMARFCSTKQVTDFLTLPWIFLSLVGVWTMVQFWF